MSDGAVEGPRTYVSLAPVLIYYAKGQELDRNRGVKRRTDEGLKTYLDHLRHLMFCLLRGTHEGLDTDLDHLRHLMFRLLRAFPLGSRTGHHKGGTKWEGTATLPFSSCRCKAAAAASHSVLSAPLMMRDMFEKQTPREGAKAAPENNALGQWLQAQGPCR